MNLQECKTRADVAKFLDISEKQLIMQLYVKGGVKQFYHTFNIEKKNGDQRVIHAPMGYLKSHQKKIAKALTKIYLQKPRQSAIGFIPHRNIVDGARIHVLSKYILNIDFQDFFNQIHFGRVCGMLEKGLHFEHNVAVIIAQLVTLDGKLPQGAPTSPIITNLICSKMDCQLEKLSRNLHIKYSRYADDLTFSSHQTFPENIVYLENGKIQLGSDLKEIFLKNTFQVYEEKIFLNNYKNHQEVTGLVVNKIINVRRSYIKNLRSSLYNARKEIENHKQIDQKTINTLRGKINYLKMIRGEENGYFIKYALEFNQLFGETFTKIEHKYNFDQWIERRVAVIDTYEEKTYGVGNGTCFQIDGIGIVTCYHVLENIISAGISEIIIYDQTLESRCIHINIDNIEFDEIEDIAIIKHTFMPKNSLIPNYTFDFKEKSPITLSGFPEFDFTRGSAIKVTNTSDYSKRFYLKRYVYAIDQPIRHGQSGGPVLDDEGKVIGIITNGSGEKETESPVYGFIPISRLKSLI